MQGGPAAGSSAESRQWADRRRQDAFGDVDDDVALEMALCVETYGGEAACMHCTLHLQPECAQACMHGAIILSAKAYAIIPLAHVA